MLSALAAVMAGMTCPDCGRKLLDTTTMGPETRMLDEYRCGCAGRVRWLDRQTGRVVRDEVEPPAAGALDDRD